jgi:hypothetical protein
MSPWTWRCEESKRAMSSEKGASPLELALGLMLIVVPVAVMALSVAPIFEHHNFARRAAAEAARTLVLNPTESGRLDARNLVTTLAVGHNVDPELIEVRFCGGDFCSLDRGSMVSVEVVVRVAEVSAFLPIGNMTVTATHAEQIDPYRSRP